MNAPAYIGIANAVTLEQILAARELRATRQAAALARFARPLVSVTVVMPGPVKDSALPRRVLTEALTEIDSVVSIRTWPVLSREVSWQETGPEALYVIDMQSDHVKSVMIALEDRHRLGRLWDLDVIACGPRILSRKELHFGPRRCLVCERPASECARSRRHPLPQLLETMQTMLDEYDRHLYA